MSQEYRWTGNEGKDEVVFATDENQLFVRVIEHDPDVYRDGAKEDIACVIVPEEEIDKMITALNRVKWKIAEYRLRTR